MGLRSWLRNRASRLFRRTSKNAGSASANAAGTPAPAPVSEIAPGYPLSDWEEVPAYLPVDPKDHVEACLIASAIAAGDHPQSEFRITGLSTANPEHRRVTCIATALGAGALEKSSFTVKRIYRKKVLEEPHAA